MVDVKRLTEVVRHDWIPNRAGGSGFYLAAKPVGSDNSGCENTWPDLIRGGTQLLWFMVWL